MNPADVLIGTLAVLAFTVAVLWAIATLFLSGEDLSPFDQPGGERLAAGMAPSAELKSVVASLSGFRDAMRVIRLRAAVLLLSAPDGTPSDVARIVGYGSLDAMGRAFRDAHLPAPSVVQEAVRYR